MKGVDNRVVVNADQARAPLDAVRQVQPSGPRLVAFFGVMYFGALRPGEAATLRQNNLDLPAAGWGELMLERSPPEAGAAWTDSGRRREERGSKHRAGGETRTHVAQPPGERRSAPVTPGQDLRATEARTRWSRA